MIEIRSADFIDLPFLQKAEGRIFSDPWGEEALEGHFEGAFGRGLILCCDGEEAGYLIASRIAGEAELLRIAVLPEFRRRGLGETLLSHWLAEEKKAGSSRFFLEVRGENRGARALYEKMGFSPVGRRAGYYSNPSDDAVLYQLLIKETNDENTCL